MRKLTHQDLSQLQLYVNYYDRTRRAPDANPTSASIFAPTKRRRGAMNARREPAGYLHVLLQAYLPTKEQLNVEIKCELRELSLSPMPAED